VSKESVMDGLSQLTISMYFQMKVQGFERKYRDKDIFFTHVFIFLVDFQIDLLSCSLTCKLFLMKVIWHNVSQS
jgi:hypothetical protein